MLEEAREFADARQRSLLQVASQESRDCQRGTFSEAESPAGGPLPAVRSLSSLRIPVKITHRASSTRGMSVFETVETIRCLVSAYAFLLDGM